MLTTLVDGPLWYLATTVFLTGVIWRLGAIIRRGFANDLSLPRGSGAVGAFRTILRRVLPARGALRPARFQLIAGYAFHLGLFVLVLFAAPHIEFIEKRILGFGWTPIPYWAFVISAEIAFAGLIALWLHRLMHPVTRLLSTLDDYLACALTFIAMFTGCMALFQSFEALRVLHLFCVELLLVYFPFSSLMHAFTLVLSRGLTGATYTRHGVGV